MVGTILNIIIEQLNNYILTLHPDDFDPGQKPVELGNMAKTQLAGETSSQLEDKIVVSLVNVAEEASLKNKPNSYLLNGQEIERFPPVHVNLFLLFAVNTDHYERALNLLIRVLEFFQARRIFKLKNMPGMPTGAQNTDLEELELTIEIHTLSFEQLNDLWGSLGGKQVPFILYRVRLFPVQMQLPQGRTGLITEIDMNTYKFLNT